MSRDKPHHPPKHPHEPAPLPRVRRLSAGVHFGLACIGLFFLVIGVYWYRGSHEQPLKEPISPAAAPNR